MIAAEGLPWADRRPVLTDAGRAWLDGFDQRAEPAGRQDPARVLAAVEGFLRWQWRSYRRVQAELARPGLSARRRRQLAECLDTERAHFHGVSSLRKAGRGYVSTLS